MNLMDQHLATGAWKVNQSRTKGREVALKALADQHSQRETLFDVLSKQQLLLDEFAKQQKDRQAGSKSLEKQRQQQNPLHQSLTKRHANLEAKFTKLDQQKDHLSSSKVGPAARRTEASPSGKIQRDRKTTPLTRPNSLQQLTLQTGMGRAQQWLQRLWRGR